MLYNLVGKPVVKTIFSPQGKFYFVALNASWYENQKTRRKFCSGLK